jgi:type II secretory pathway pseudopilin PulG
VILTGAIVILIIIAVVFANNFLNRQIAENDFSAMEQFMQTAALQLDNVAWTIGRTQTISYTSKYGQVNFQTAALSYAVYIGTSKVLTNTTGIILFNVPTNEYSISNNYFQRIPPSSSGSFLQNGTSAPIAQVFAVEKLPMSDGSYVRVVLAPTIRMLNSKIGNQTYYEFYLPCLVQGSHPYYSQSITIATQNVAIGTITIAKPTTININVTFPNAALGFSSSFFNFQSTTVPVNIKPGSGSIIVEFYVGEVIVSLGLYA